MLSKKELIHIIETRFPANAAFDLNIETKVLETIKSLNDKGEARILGKISSKFFYTTKEK